MSGGRACSGAATWTRSSVKSRSKRTTATSCEQQKHCPAVEGAASEQSPALTCVDADPIAGGASQNPKAAVSASSQTASSSTPTRRQDDAIIMVTVTHAAKSRPRERIRRIEHFIN